MTSLGDGFEFRNRELHCEGVPLSRIADEFGTPTYVYSKTAIIERVRRLRSGWSGKPGFDCRILFAVKACGNIHVLGLLQEQGCGADIVSGGELFRAAAAQFSPDAVVYSGVGKSERELREALSAAIHMFNAESFAELETLERLSRELGRRPNVSLRINPDIDAKTHPYISTGLKKNKFGLARGELRQVYRSLDRFPNLNFMGLSCHIGSQITTARPFVQAWKALASAAEQAPFNVTHLDLGGGLGISYGREKTLSLESYGRLVLEVFQGTKYQLAVEPGRSLVGPTAVLLTRLVSAKSRARKTFYVVDAAMNDLIRPALYQATHPTAPVLVPRSRRRQAVTLVGPICETADTFHESLRLPPLEAGALLAFGNAGAYGMSMASQYNSRPRAAEVLVEGPNYKLIRRRETYGNLIEHEIV